MDLLEFTQDSSAARGYQSEYFRKASGVFSVSLGGEVIVGGGRDSSYKCLKEAWVFQGGQFKQLQPLIKPRTCSAALYYPASPQNQNSYVICSGGLSWGGYEKSVEYLTLGDGLTTTPWRLSNDLPFKVCNHQLNILGGKLVLTGGRNGDSGESSNQVYEGSISFDPFNVKWTPLPSMLQSRTGHVAFVVADKLYCIGGYNGKSTEFFSYKSNTWERGPELPVHLYGAKGVVDPSTNKLILIGGRRNGAISPKIGFFDKTGYIEMNIELTSPRHSHFAAIM